MKRKYDFWEMVFYISLFILFIWVILKSVGIIQTPVWLEFGVPAVTIISIVLAFFKEIMEPIKQTAIGLATLNVKFDHLDSKVNNLDSKVSNMDTKLNLVCNDVEFLKRKVIK